MNGVAASFMLVDPGAILDRHAVRRAAGVPTVSVLVGPIGAGGRTWRRWAAEKGRSVVVASGRLFPCTEWAHAAAAEVDLPAAAVRCLAQRAGRESGELLAEWRAKTPADRERFWDALAPNADDDLIRAVASLPLDPGSRSAAAELVRGLGERIVPAIAAIAPSPRWPSILFVAGGIDELLSVSSGMAEWVMRMPGLPVAVAVPTIVWDEYVNSAIESRTKALLKQGELVIPGIQAATVEQRLAEAGVGGGATAAISASGVDAILLDSAVAAAQATAAAPATEAEDDRARSAAERFLFTFLESLPETAGRFELNGVLDCMFGGRPAEVDLLCRSPRIAIELDGYFHFVTPDCYRRDRGKIGSCSDKALSSCDSWRKTSFRNWRVSATGSLRHSSSQHLEHDLDHCTGQPIHHGYRRRRPCARSDGAAKHETREPAGGAGGRRQVTGRFLIGRRV